MLIAGWRVNLHFKGRLFQGCRSGLGPASSHGGPANFLLSLGLPRCICPIKVCVFEWGPAVFFCSQRRRLGLGFNFSSALPRCWGFSLGLTRESLHHHFWLMVRRIWPWAQPLQPSQPIIFALPPAPVSIASLASGGRFDMLMPSGALDSAEIILMLFFLTAALAAWIFI